MPEFSSSHHFVSWCFCFYQVASNRDGGCSTSRTDTSTEDNGSKSLATDDVSSYFSKKMNPKRNKMRVSNKFYWNTFFLSFCTCSTNFIWLQKRLRHWVFKQPKNLHQPKESTLLIEWVAMFIVISTREVAYLIKIALLMYPWAVYNWGNQTRRIPCKYFLCICTQGNISVSWAAQAWSRDWQRFGKGSNQC